MSALAAMFLMGCQRVVGPPGDVLRASAEATGWVREEGLGGAGPMWTWCSAPDPMIGCLGVAVRAGTGWRILEADRWEAADFPVEGWGGKLVVEVEDWSLLLVRFSGGAETDRFSLGRRMSLTVEITDVEADGGGELAPLLDERTVTAAACDQLERLYGAARAKLDAGEVRRCHYGRYLGDASIECRPVPLPPAEVQAWRTDLRNEQDRHCGQVRDDAAALSALARRLWPR